MEADTQRSAPAEGRSAPRTAGMRGPPAPRRLRGRTGGAPAAPGPLRDAPDFPAGGWAGRGRPRPPSPAEGGRAGSGASPRGRRLSPARPVPAAPAGIRSRRGRCRGRGGSALLGGTGAAAPPARPSFSWQSSAAGSAATPAPPRRPALRAACAAPRTAPAPAPRVNKVAVGGLEEANCPGGGLGKPRLGAVRGAAGGADTSGADTSGWPRLRGRGRAGAAGLVCAPPSRPPCALGPSLGTGAAHPRRRPALLPRCRSLAHSHTSQTHTHKPCVRLSLPHWSQRLCLQVAQT